MDVYALIVQGRMDNDLLIGIYSSLEAAKAGYLTYEGRSDHRFYRVEKKQLDPAIADYDCGTTVDDGRYEEADW